jgi:hypothetical protein
MAAATDHFVKAPWTGIMAGAIASPTVLSSYELFSRPSSSERPDLLGYAGAALPGSLHFEKLPDMQVACSLSAAHCFTFDRATRVLSRRAAWW